MDSNEYQKLAMRTMSGLTDFTTVALALCSETGELAGAFKKHRSQGHPLDEDNVAEELGDILWYVVAGCELLGISLDGLMRANIKKLESRYKGKTFTAEESVGRDVGNEAIESILTIKAGPATGVAKECSTDKS